jgi:hypothetical protein
MNEAETRAEHIAPALAAAGWGIETARRDSRRTAEDAKGSTTRMERVATVKEPLAAQRKGATA